MARAKARGAAASRQMAGTWPVQLLARAARRACLHLGRVPKSRGTAAAVINAGSYLQCAWSIQIRGHYYRGSQYLPSPRRDLMFKMSCPSVAPSVRGPRDGAPSNPETAWDLARSGIFQELTSIKSTAFTLFCFAKILEINISSTACLHFYFPRSCICCT
jgi:hypothetical protein